MQGGFHEYSHPPGSCDHAMDEPPPLLPGGLLFSKIQILYNALYLEAVS